MRPSLTAAASMRCMTDLTPRMVDALSFRGLERRPNRVSRTGILARFSRYTRMSLWLIDERGPIDERRVFEMHEPAAFIAGIADASALSLVEPAIAEGSQRRRAREAVG